MYVRLNATSSNVITYENIMFFLLAHFAAPFFADMLCHFYINI